MVATTQNIAQLSAETEIKGGESLTTKALRRLRKDKLTLFAILVILVLTILSVFAPFFENLVGVDYRATTATQGVVKFSPVCMPVLGIGGECDAKHILGTDDLGRDVFARLLYAGRISLGIGFFAAILSLAIGVTLGMYTGYFGGGVDDFVNWVITTLNSIPSLFLLLILSASILSNPALKNTVFDGPFALVLILGLLGWTGTTRLVRGETLALREREFIVSARALGASPWRIMFSHILPNLLSIIIITLALDIGGLILVEAGLSYLGLGIKEPNPSWGSMLTKAKDYYTYGVHLVILPGLLIFVAVLCLYVIGDGLRDAFDPTARD